MTKTKKFSPEVHERTVRMVQKVFRSTRGLFLVGLRWQRGFRRPKRCSGPGGGARVQADGSGSRRVERFLSTRLHDADVLRRMRLQRG